MPLERKTRRAELVTVAFDSLASHPDGLLIDTLLSQIEREYPLDKSEKVPNRYHGFKPFEETVLTGMIPLISAGWVVDSDGNWRVTSKGANARALYSTPDNFYRCVARESFKSWLVVHFPRVFAVLSRLLNQYHIEVKTIDRLGWRLILKSVLGLPPAWRRALPVQKALRYELPDLTIPSYEGLERYLKSSAISYNNAGHTFYLPPGSARLSAFGPVMKNYPADAGLKILKRRGDAKEAYLFGDIRNRRISIWYNWITYNRDLLLLVANLFHTRGIGARIHDLIEMNCGGHIWSAYVVEHVTGRVPSASECQSGIDEIRRLEAEGLLKLTLTEGYEDQDLTPPTCNNNAFVDDAGRFRYVDFQSFLLIDYQEYLNTLASKYESPRINEWGGANTHALQHLNEASEIAEFVEQWNLPARFEAISTVLSKAGIEMADRLVLDLDTGDPLSFVYFLKRGAGWCHGWWNTELAEWSEKLLRALGCTRFTIGSIEQGATSNAGRSCGLPDFLEPLIGGCVVVSSAPNEFAQRSILERIKWSYLISTAREWKVSASGCAVKGRASYRDRDGETKTITLFANTAAPHAVDTAKVALAGSSRWATP